MVFRKLNTSNYAKVRTETDRIIMQKYMDTFTDARKDSKAWNEAADFLEEYFDENNIRLR